MTDSSVKASTIKTPVITIILAVSLVMALAGAGLLSMAWQKGEKRIAELEDGAVMYTSQITSLQDDLSGITAEKEDLADHITELETLFPPRNFNDTDELVGWLESAVPQIPEGNSLQRHLDLQKMALADGYTWSIWVDVSNPELTYVGSHVVAGDTIYLVDTTNGALMALHTSSYFIEE